MKRIRGAVKYHGGKYFLCRWIIEQFPEHNLYVEPFGGAATVLLNKPIEMNEIYNDLEYGIFNLYRVIKTQLPELLLLIKNFDYCKESFLSMRKIFLNSELFNVLPNCEQAFVVYAMRRMSRGGLCETYSKSSIIYNGLEQNYHSWMTMIPELKIIHDRLQHVILFNEKAENIIRMFDNFNTLFYLDPPYPNNTRFSSNNYLKEMSDLDHRNLISLIKKCRGKVIISSYPNEIYDDLGWHVIDKNITKHASQSKIKGTTTERLYLNF